jgi:hypothetical protein
MACTYKTAFKEHSGNIQGTWRTYTHQRSHGRITLVDRDGAAPRDVKHSGNIQGTFREYGVHIPINVHIAAMHWSIVMMPRPTM